MEQRIWFITGVRTGLGRALAERALEAGDAVVGTTRDGLLDIRHDDLRILRLDLTDQARIAPAVQEAFDWRGRIDILVNNAGAGLFGAVEETSDADALDAFAVNFHAPRRILRAALPRLREQLRGHIVNISSVAATDPKTGSAIYAAAKAALLAMTEALPEELKPFQLKVTAVLPGAFRTAFLDHSERLAVDEHSPYAPTAGAALKHFAGRAGLQQGDPTRAAEAIIQAVETEQPPLFLFLGEDSVRRTRARLARIAADLDTWEATSLNTQYQETVDA